MLFVESFCLPVWRSETSPHITSGKRWSGLHTYRYKKAEIVASRVAERGSEARFAEKRVCSTEEDDREHLRGEDTQESGERIDGGVGDGGALEPASSHCKPVAKNFAPAPRPTAAKKSARCEFAEGEVGIHQHVPDLAPDATNTAEDERDDKGAASEAELDRLRHSGESDGQRSKARRRG
jgi:hypothetical protein